MPPAVWAGAAVTSAATTTIPAAMPQVHDLFTGIPLRCVPVIVPPAALPQAPPLDSPPAAGAYHAHPGQLQSTPKGELHASSLERPPHGGRFYEHPGNGGLWRRAPG